MYKAVKRILDFSAALVAILLTWPFFLMIMLAIALDSKGPVFFVQKRVKKDKKLFNIYKFRTMRIDTPKDVATDLLEDPQFYMTIVGRVLRKYSLDELPQLFNILAGDMSVVGPRPERPEFSREYEQTTPAFSLRLQVKAGLTGYAQVYGRYNTKPMEKLQMDLIYINNMSIIEDLRLIFATLKILLIRESMVGVKQVQTSASEGRERV